MFAVPAACHGGCLHSVLSALPVVLRSGRARFRVRWSSQELSLHLARRGGRRGRQGRLGPWQGGRGGLGAVRTCSRCAGAHLHPPSRVPRPPHRGTALALMEDAVPLLADTKAITAV